MRRSLWIIWCLCACLFAAAQEKQPIVIGQAIDFLDNCFFTQRGDYYSKEELRDRLETAYAAGVRRIYFRGAGGMTYYPSSVRRMYTGSHNNEWAMKLYKTIHSYDVVAEYVKVCHELGMELYYWDTLFDMAGYSGSYPGSEYYANFGPDCNVDTSIKLEHCVRHRQALNRPCENLHGAIGEMRLHLASPPSEPLTAENLLIYTAPHDGDFVRYDKPFKVRMEGNDVIISDLYIYNPVVKFAGDFRAISETKSPEAAKATYTNGEAVDLFVSCEIVLEGDEARERVRHGSAGYGCDWGDKASRRTFIVRFGDFDRYARGVPDYAYRDNRERMERIVTELFERYPDLDGVALSIRSHSLPCGGHWGELGGGNLFYGFSEPAVEDYKRRYGVDPTVEDYDEQLFLKLRGEYFTQMLDGVAKIVHAKGGRLSVMAPVRPQRVGPYDHGSMYPWLYRYSIDNYFDIETWAKRGIVDSVMMLGTGHKQHDWTQGWKDEVKAFKAKLAGTSTKLTLHFLVNDDPGPENLQALLPEVLKEGDIDEVEFYEEVHMYECQKYPLLDEALKKAMRPLAPCRWTK